MKRFLAVIFSLAVFSACNSSDSGISHDAIHEHGASDNVNPPGHNDTTTSLTDGIPNLNNGAKWQADKSTNDNVANLHAIVRNFREQNPSPEASDYRAFNGAFTEGLGKMVRECKMQGPDHDALHVWLEPLMKDNKDMGSIESKESLASLLNTIQERLDIYPDYFQ